MLALTAFAAVLISIPPHDLWWQLRTGRIIAAEHHIPTRDRFSFTAKGDPWLVQEWLSCLIFYALQNAFGLDSLVVLQAVLITVAILALAAACRMRGANGLLSMGVTALAIWAARPWFAIRPQLFTYALLSVTLALLETYRRTGKTGWLLILPPLTVLWANLHAGSLLSPVILTLETVGAGAEALRAYFSGDSETERQLRRSAVAFGGTAFGVLLATLLTPSGFALWRYPGLVTHHPLVVDFITEWFSPNFHASGLYPVAWIIGLLMAVMIVGGPEPPYRDFPLVALTLATGMVYRRNLPLFALVAAPILAGRAWEILERNGWERRIRWAWVGLAACSFSLTPVASAVTRWPKDGWFAAQAGNYDFPVEAVRFLEAHPPVGPMLNEYRWGGYLIWKLPQVPVFIDGRAEVYYRRRVFDDYVKVHRLEPGWEMVLSKYKIRTLLSERWMGVAQVLLMDPNWKVAYEDSQAIVLERSPWE